MIALEVIEDCDGLQHFQPEWSEFVRSVSPATPFQTPEWLAAWWSHFGSGTLRVMVFRQKGEVAGVLPCFLHQWNGRRQMTLLGAGISDYLDPLFGPACVDKILERIREQLRGRSDWDVCDWQDLSLDTPLGALGTVIEDTPCSTIAIEQPFEAFLAARPNDLRRNLRRYKKKAEAMGCMRFDVAESANIELMDALITLHGARWAKTGEAGMIEQNRSEAFLRDIAERFGARGLLRIFSLRFKDRVAAIILAFCDGKAICGYLSAFDPRYAEFGFGRELLAQALRYAHERGYRRWDFLRGTEPYKFSWGAQALAKCRVMIRS
ncbi:MAG TPA: GNAT family N-acetyltransferase [Bryobacteraceae bacterium]|nr:GNAT family N-acetyltransferase [Bryobacteraceae bacterium]